jgi:signal recognition particle receptor subunit beta
MAKAKKNKSLAPETMRFLQAENPVGYNIALNKSNSPKKKNPPRYESDNAITKNPRSRG